MTRENICLTYLPEYDSYGIADSKVLEITGRGNTPLISLGNEDYKQLANKEADPQNPTVSFLMCREDGYYTVPADYAKSIAKTGLNMRFLTYKENLRQMDGTDGLILPGGNFDSPDIFYTDPLKINANAPDIRSCAYLSSIAKAEKEQMPILGICAGAQMVGGMHGLRIYRNIQEYTSSSLEHENPNLTAHEVTIFPETPLSKMFPNQLKIITNSRHSEGIMPDDKTSDLKIYAVSADEIPEAWGNEEKKILCIQWHPENFAAQGDDSMQKIYNWIAQKAYLYKQQKSLI